MTGARVPFALIGVLLLVGSATFVGTMQSPKATEPTVDAALDRTAAESQSAVRDGVTTAAQEAARQPVTRPAETDAGAVLNDSNPFRDSLRVRVYVTVRDKLARLAGSHGGIRVTATLPPTDSPTALREAKHRVTLEKAGADGAALRATVTNVSLTASRDGRIVGTRTLSPTVTVPVPTLFVHEKASRFEQRLNAETENPGLGRRLTAALYALTWIRGYAQFSGTPISNIVANRHIGLFTNDAVLAMQREVFGNSDQKGESLLAWATANTALTDAIDGGGHPITEKLSTVHDDVQGERTPAVLAQHHQARTPGASPINTTTVGINETADRAFLSAAANLSRAADQAYEVSIRRETAVTETFNSVSGQHPNPGQTWTLRNVSVSNQTIVSKREGGQQPVAEPWHRLSSHPRWVNHTRSVTRTWDTSNGQKQTVEQHRTAHAVTVTLSGRHDHGKTPIRPFRTVHERGGPLQGPNLDDITEKAQQRLLKRPGGTDEIAREIRSADEQAVSDTVIGDQPPTLSRWLYRDLVSLRERVRNVSVTLPKGQVATMQTNPATQLRHKLRTEREQLLDVPQTYDGVASRARIAARRTYLNRVQARLQSRALAYDQRRTKLEERLADTGVGSLDSLRSAYENRNISSPTRAHTGVQMQVTTAPSYLTLGELSGNAIAGIPSGTSEHPLVARNHNLFTVPYGDVADAVTKGVLDTARTRLQTAAQVLASAGTVNTNRTEQLHRAVTNASRYLQSVAVETLAGVVSRTESERKAVVRTALARWNETETRATALTNGSAATAIQREARARWQLSYRESDRVELLLEQNLDAARLHDAARPPQNLVKDHGGTIRRLLKSRATGAVSDATKRETKRALEKLAGKSLSHLPAGLPLAPLPPVWYLTINYWDIEVAGEYARFVVHVPYGTADSPGGRLSYVRDGSVVELDVDGDGTSETLGRSTRVSFRTQTSVAIAVGPQPRGVGDKNGQMTERSPGWPDAGAE